jgi:hypothetical protein
MKDLLVLVVAVPVLLIYIGAVVAAAARPARFRLLWQALPYLVVAAVIVLTGTSDPLDMLGFFVVLGACTWVIVWSVRKTK